MFIAAFKGSAILLIFVFGMNVSSYVYNQKKAANAYGYVVMSWQQLRKGTEVGCTKRH